MPVFSIGSKNVRTVNTGCVKLGKSYSKILKILKEAYGEAAILKSAVLEWHKWFKEEREDVEDDGRFRVFNEK